MATPFPFGSGNVLTAAQMNAITTLPVSTKTGSYTLTVADVGYRIVMNSASATTITVNTSIFGASDKVEILNIGAGVCTVTAGTCTVGTTGSLALAQNAGGTLTFISASASVFTASGVTATTGGLVPIVPTSAAVGSGTATFSSTTGFVTVTAASSVSLNGVFTATYNNYFINFNLLAAAGTPVPTFRVRAAGTDLTTSTYLFGNSYVSTGAVGFTSGSGSATSITLGQASTTGGATFMNINSPFLAQRTLLTFNGSGNDIMNFGGGIVSNTTSYDGFTFITPTSTLTGTISVYGYNQ